MPGNCTIWPLKMLTFCLVSMAFFFRIDQTYYIFSVDFGSDKQGVDGLYGSWSVSLPISDDAFRTLQRGTAVGETYGPSNPSRDPLQRLRLFRCSADTGSRYPDTSLVPSPSRRMPGSSGIKHWYG